jgi:hypothetical protein
MSGPAITGIVALMLEANPQLSPAHIREILCATTRNDSQTGPLHERDSISDIWGWGKVNALAAVNEALAHVDIREADEDWFAKSLQVYPNPATTVLNIQADGLQKVELMDMGGRRIITTTQPQLNIGQLPRGAYFVRITTANSTTVKRVVKK